MRPGVGKILPGEEVTVTGRDLDVWDWFKADNEIDLVSGKVICADGANVLTCWSLCAQSGDAIVAIPKVSRVRQPEGVVMELQINFLGRLRAELEPKVVDIAPTELVHQPVFIVVRRKE